MTSELEALGHVAFRTAYAGNDIWPDDVIHVDGIHSWPFFRVVDTLARLRDGVLVGNLVIRGRPGIGKSHFLGRVRHAVIEQGQIFVLFQPSTARRFWDSLALAYVDALHRRVGAGGSQLRTVLVVSHFDFACQTSPWAVGAPVGARRHSQSDRC